MEKNKFKSEIIRLFNTLTSHNVGNATVLELVQALEENEISEKDERKRRILAALNYFRRFANGLS